ncbi:MAG: hypothetical protein R2877_02390 [Bdellovibrionota bacterium]
MKKLIIAILVLSSTAYGFDLTPADECQNFLASSIVSGFQSLSTNGASTSMEEFNQVLDFTFEQIKKNNKSKPKQKQFRDFEIDKLQIKSYTQNNDVVKIYIGMRAHENETYQNVYPDSSKPLRAMTFMNALAADSLTQLKELPLPTQVVFPGRLKTLQYAVMQIDGQTRETGDFIRCNCYMIDNVRMSDPMLKAPAENSWTCGSSLQKPIDVDFIRGN